VCVSNSCDHRLIDSNLALNGIHGLPIFQDAKFGIGSTSSQEVAHLPIEETQAVEGPGDVELSIPDAAVDDDDVSEEVPDFRCEIYLSYTPHPSAHRYDRNFVHSS
jgi:hypothetical protein